MHRRSTRVFLCALALAALIGIADAARADYPQIRLNHDTSSFLQNEQQICVNPTNLDNLVACWRDWRLGYRQVGVGYSFDGGQTWTDYLIGGPLPWDSDPVLTVHKDGTFYLVVINYRDGAENTLAIHRSTTGGATWDGPFTAVYSNGSTFEDKEWLAVDRTNGPRSGNVYVTWSRFYDVKVMCVRSSDRGQTWSAPVQVSDAGVVGQYSVPIVMRNGNLLVAWNTYYTNKIAYDISADGGTTWGTDRTLTTVTTPAQSDINGSITVFPYPALTMDETIGPRSGYVYCVYPDAAVASNGMDIWCRRSTDSGLTWSNRVRVNDDPTGVNRDQFHPWVYCDESGVLHASWYDRRDDAANYQWHIYYAKSTDGGQTWTANERITDVASSPGQAGVEPETEGPEPRPVSEERGGLIGEYSGITAARGVAFPIWTDTRNGNQDTYASILRNLASAENVTPRTAQTTLSVAPNPVRDSGEIALSLPIAADARVEVFDLGGRLVRTFAPGGLPVGVTRFTWDGHDDAGKALPDGVYFVRLVDAAHPQGARTKIVLARG
jgi:hypothetical protein